MIDSGKLGVTGFRRSYKETAMIAKTFSPKVTLGSLVLMLVMQAGACHALSLARSQAAHSLNPAASSEGDLIDVRGTWSGKFVSKHPENPAFTMTVIVSPDANGDLIGRSTLNSRCLKRAQLKVTVEGSRIIFAGSDEQGDSITVRGTIDETGAIVKAAYILDGSATGRCETDDGTGTLTRQ
jgi:hypothetical protein